VVYNAYYKPLNKRVAAKVIDLDMFERNQIDELRRETQVMALCKHANVLRVNGAFVKDSKLYIIMPYLSAGKSISGAIIVPLGKYVTGCKQCNMRLFFLLSTGSCLDIMKTAHPDGLDEVSIATILKQALQGLDYLHKNGHIHRQVNHSARTCGHVDKEHAASLELENVFACMIARIATVQTMIQTQIRSPFERGELECGCIECMGNAQQQSTSTRLDIDIAQPSITICTDMHQSPVC